MRSVGTTLLVVTLSAGLASCGRDEPRPAPPPQPASVAVTRAPQGPTLSAAAYIAAAGSMDLFEVRSARLALQRSQNSRIREFASMMISAHEGTAAQLSFAGRRLNLLPPANLSARHEAMIAELMTTSDFDGTYKRQQLTVHQEALPIHRNFAARGSSPTLRPVAAAAVPIVERHLRMLRYL